MLYSTKTIELLAYCPFLDTVVISIEMPYDPFKSIHGHYSKLWPKLKPVISEMVSGAPIVLRKKIQNKKSDRVLFKWPNGTELDMPYGFNSMDVSIVLKQLEVLQMSRT